MSATNQNSSSMLECAFTFIECFHWPGRLQVPIGPAVCCDSVICKLVCVNFVVLANQNHSNMIQFV